MNKSAFKIKGLTLVELMITLATSGLLLTTAAPDFSEFIQNNRAVKQIGDLHTSLGLARSEAIKRNNNVTVCQSSDGASCSGLWQNGWIIFVDNDSDGQVDVGDEVVRAYGSLTGGNTLTFSQTRVIYASSGLIRANSSGVFTLCDVRGSAKAKGVVIGLSGRARPATPSDLTSVLEEGDNPDLICS